jgi:hypothetical protein
VQTSIQKFIRRMVRYGGERGRSRRESGESGEGGWRGQRVWVWMINIR